jgi:ADP-ribosylglycohydrolase
MITMRDRIKGMFLGIAIGDALYMPTETFGPRKIEEKFGGRVTTYFDSPPGHPFHDDLKAGTWTDDTQLTLVVAESIISKSYVDMDDVAERHVRAWAETKHGWGGTTRDAVLRIQNGTSWRDSGSLTGSGNGIPMKIAPIGAMYALLGYNIPYQLFIDFAAMTHRSRLGIESGYVHANAIEYCLRMSPDHFSTIGFVSVVSNTQDGCFLRCFPEEIDMTQPSVMERILMLRNIPLNDLDVEIFRKLFGKGNGYVYDSLPFSYAFFLRNPQSIESLYDVGNAGGDTDTNASIVGGLLGALHGPDIFPEHLVKGLYRSDYILDVADRFCAAFGK